MSIAESTKKGMLEIRWHARAGQGAVTAAKLTAEVALSQDKHFQAFPEYGPERTGAPILAFNRISNDPIYVHCDIEYPDIVVVVDPTLLPIIDVTKGILGEGTIIVNTPHAAADIKRDFPSLGKHKVYTVDASKIGHDEIGKPLPNTPMLGALTRVADIFELDQVLDHIKESFGKKFSEKIINGNLAAVRRAYKEVSA